MRLAQIFLVLSAVCVSRLNASRAKSKKSHHLPVNVVNLLDTSVLPEKDISERVCTDGPTGPILLKLRSRMTALGISAYIVETKDEHQSELVSAHDSRRKYLTGFTGSAGTAIVTLKSAVLWTDSRYHLQAGIELDCNWTLMKQGKPNVTNYEDWIVAEIKTGTISTDSRILSKRDYDKIQQNFDGHDIQLVPVPYNLVDEIWENRPPPSTELIQILSIKYAGMSWQEKVQKIRKQLIASKADCIIVSALDEIAWTLNLRGADIPYSPVFIAYLAIGLDAVILYVDQGKVTKDVRIHLNSDGTQEGDSVSIKDYKLFYTDLTLIGQQLSKILIPDKYSGFQGSSCFIHSQISESKIVNTTSPILLMKAIKNAVESEGMRQAHIRDGVALCQFFRVIEQDVTKGIGTWTELRIVDALEVLRRKQKLNVGSSFRTIAAFAENSALPHYASRVETNKVVDTSAPLLIDSGGQYIDGTIDVTRVLHFGQPRPIEREVYTRLLMGCIDLVTTIFPKGKTRQDLEQVIRSPLHKVGLNFGHGTTHGIGSFLNVHESFNETYNEGFFGSQEPGYYKEDDFGMRLENIVTVVSAKPKYESDEEYLTFSTVTMTPYEKKLIDVSLLDKRHIKWINEYHQEVLIQVGGEMIKQGLIEDYQWLKQKAKPLNIV